MHFVRENNELDDVCTPLKRLNKKKGYTANIENKELCLSAKYRPAEEDPSAIPSELMELVTTAKKSDIRDKLDEMWPSEFNISTYAQTFRTLLHLEELNTLQESQKHMQPEARFYHAKKIDGKEKISIVFSL